MLWTWSVIILIRPQASQACCLPTAAMDCCAGCLVYCFNQFLNGCCYVWRLVFKCCCRIWEFVRMCCSRVWEMIRKCCSYIYYEYMERRRAYTRVDDWSSEVSINMHAYMTPRYYYLSLGSYLQTMSSSSW